MKNSLFRLQTVGFIFTSVAGVILHFAYEWSNKSMFFALFSAINESIWEHMKLLFFPLLVYALTESFFISDRYKNFWGAKLIGILSGILIIPTIYYTYTGIFGASVDWLNILIFFIAAATVFLIESAILRKENILCIPKTAVLIIFSIITLLFIIFTFFPPDIPLFEDPTTGISGI